MYLGMNKMLEVSNITKKFGEVTAVDNLSFNVNKGEVLGIVGQNGAGKSTTFKMIMNFLKPDQGSITVNGHELNEKVLDTIGFLPEERGLYLDMTIKQQVLYFAGLHGYDLKRASADLPLWMDALSVKGNEKTKIKNLSKGNQQKVQLITSLIHRPKLVILDEPFSGLDPVNIELLVETVKKLKKNGTAVIFSSHNMKNVAEVSDKILMIVNGKPRLYGPINEVREKFGKTKIYLEGVFDDLSIGELSGALESTDDYPGKIITFDSEKHAKSAIMYACKFPSLQGYRLLPPTLDDIFRLVIKKEEK